MPVGRRDTGEGRDADGGAGLLHGLEHSGRGASVSARDSRENRDTERQEARTGPMPKSTSGPNRLSR